MSGQGQNDMLDYYPDLSDDEDEKPVPDSQPQKAVKPNESSAPTSEAAAPSRPKGMMPFLMGKFIPPPPPPGSKPPSYSHPPPPVPPPPPQRIHQPHQNQSRPPGEQPPRVERQRKNCVFVKNIPKHYNESEKLMTFFKNEGAIKQIRCNVEESAAMVRFHKEENAVRFINSKKAIFNRSFITYSLNQKDPVPPELRKERQNEENGSLKKPIEVEMKIVRERLDSQLADKIRGLLFLSLHVSQHAAQALSEIKSALSEAVGMKTMLELYDYEQLNNTARALSNSYEWTLSLMMMVNPEADKKSIQFDLLKKFGPVAQLELTPVQEISPEADPATPLPHVAKLTFLSPRHALSYYHFAQSRRKDDPQAPQVELEGPRLKQLMDDGLINYDFISPPQEKPETQKEKSETPQKDEAQLQTKKVDGAQGDASGVVITEIVREA